MTDLTQDPVDYFRKQGVSKRALSAAQKINLPSMAHFVLEVEDTLPTLKGVGPKTQKELMDCLPKVDLIDALEIVDPEAAKRKRWEVALLWEENASDKRGLYTPQMKVDTFSTLLGNDFRVPPYQRQQVWSPDRESEYLQLVMKGVSGIPLILWSLNDSLWVIDGQQRLSTLGFKLRRADGALNAPPKTLWNPCTREPVLRADAPPYAKSPIGIIQYFRENPSAGWDPNTEMWGGSPRVASDFMQCAMDIQWKIPIPVMLFNHKHSAEEVLRAFQAVNTPGVPFDVDLLARNLKEFEGWSPS